MLKVLILCLAVISCASCQGMMNLQMPVYPPGSFQPLASVPVRLSKFIKDSTAVFAKSAKFNGKYNFWRINQLSQKVVKGFEYNFFADFQSVSAAGALGVR
jgi:hypothetical protein